MLARKIPNNQRHRESSFFFLLYMKPLCLTEDLCMGDSLLQSFYRKKVRYVSFLFLVRIKCRELVKRIAIYRHRLAVSIDFLSL